MFAQNLLSYLQSKYWENVNFSCFRESYDEYKSKNLSEDSTDSYEENLKDTRTKNPQNVFIGQLNINLLRSQFDLLAEQINWIISVLVISETKLDEPFLVGQVRIPGYASLFRLDRNQRGGVIMVSASEDIPAKY